MENEYKNELATRKPDLDIFLYGISWECYQGHDYYEWLGRHESVYHIDVIRICASGNIVVSVTGLNYQKLVGVLERINKLRR